ncbi:MAG TPA: response regulator transcription factor [Gaiellaceae bacterium]|nr:response regulator transcription factor [Gaiellaceae bacterium]
MIRVLLAEDHSIVRAGLERLLGTTDDIEVVAGAEDGAQAVELAAEHKPDVVLMDISMPRLTGIEATKQIVEANEDVQVVVLTSFADRPQIVAALDAGAVGYLLKDAEPEEVIRGVRAAAKRESPFAPKVARTLLDARAQRPEIQLSERELEVLRCVAKGLPNKLIARSLGISEKTVKAHLTRIYQQIGVSDRTQAALWARERGI